MKTRLILPLLLLSLTASAQVALSTKTDEWKLDSNGDTLVCERIYAKQVKAPDGAIYTLNLIPFCKWTEKHPKPKPTDMIMVIRAEWDAVQEQLRTIQEKLFPPKTKDVRTVDHN